MNILLFYAIAVHISLGETSSKSPLLFVYPAEYVKADAPYFDQTGMSPFSFEVHFEIWSINDISLRWQDIEVDLSMQIYWLDQRLSVNHNVTSNNSWPLLDKDEVDKIWKPTLYFRNCKGCAPISINNKHDVYVQKKTGNVLTTIRLLNKFTCAINLRAYPMDTQFCQIELYLYENTEDMLQVLHMYPETQVVIGSNITPTQYHIAPIAKTQCVFKDTEEHVYSCIGMNIKLDHLIGFHLMTLYAPTSFIVILSWISFWLPIDQAPARIALGLTSLLTLATRLDQAQKDLPPVAYVKAIDVWMFACIFLVSTSLFEFAVSHRSWHLSKSKSSVKIQPMCVKEHDAFITATKPGTGKEEQTSSGSTHDRISRILFPLTFMIFNIAYWSYYLTYYN